MSKLIALEGMFMLVVGAKNIRMIEFDDLTNGRFRTYRCVLRNERMVIETTISEHDMAIAYDDHGALGIMREIARRMLTVTRRN